MCERALFRVWATKEAKGKQKKGRKAKRLRGHQADRMLRSNHATASSGFLSPVPLLRLPLPLRIPNSLPAPSPVRLTSLRASNHVTLTSTAAMATNAAALHCHRTATTLPQVLPVCYEFQPDLIIVSAGFDGVAGDPLGGCALPPEVRGCSVRAGAEPNEPLQHPTTWTHDPSWRSMRLLTPQRGPCRHCVPASTQTLATPHAWVPCPKGVCMLDSVCVAHERVVCAVRGVWSGVRPPHPPGEGGGPHHVAPGRGLQPGGHSKVGR